MIEVVITVTTTAELTAPQQIEAAMTIMSMRNESKHAMGLIFPAQGGADPRDGLEEVVARVLAEFERQRYTVKLTSANDHFSLTTTCCERPLRIPPRLIPVYFTLI